MRVDRQQANPPSERTSSRRWIRRAPAIPLIVLGLVASACSSSPGQQASGLINQGLQAQTAGNLPAAESDYSQAVAKQPNNRAALYDLAQVQQQEGKNAASEVNYRKALAVDPNYVAALYNLAILITKSNPREAELLYQQAISIQPNYANAHLNLGFLLFALGNPKQGTTQLKRAVALDPSLRSRIPASVNLGT